MEWNGEWVFEQVINTMKGKWKRNCERLKKIGEERESKKVKEFRQRGPIENGEREEKNKDNDETKASQK